MAKEKVSANQFFSLLYLSLLSTVFMYLSSSKVKIAQADSLLRPFVFVLLSFVVFVPVCLILRRCIDLKNKRQYISKSVFLRITAVLYALIYMLGIIKASARFDLFVSSELFPDSDMTIFLVAIIFACALLSTLGLGALSRSAGIFTVLVCVSTAIVMISLRGEIDFLNFTPLFENGAVEFMQEGMMFAVQATEIGTIIMFLPDIDGNVKKSFALWTILGAASFSLIFFFVVGSLGAFADTQLFPTYAAVSLASFGLLERIDALETAVWIMCVVEKISFFFLIVVKALRYALGEKYKNFILITVTATASFIISAISYDIGFFAFLSADAVSVVLFSLSAVILPISVYIYIKRVRPRDEIQENI